MGRPFFLVFGVKPHGHAIDAIAQAGGRWPMGEHMAQMRVAARAGHLGAHHVMGAVFMLFDHVIGQGRIKAWPAAARFELGRGIEQGRITAHTAIGAGAFGKAGMAERPFSCRAACDLKGQFPQFRQPFGIRFHHLVHHLLLHGAARHCLRGTSSCRKPSAGRGDFQPLARRSF